MASVRPGQAAAARPIRTAATPRMASAHQFPDTVGSMVERCAWLIRFSSRSKGPASRRTGRLAPRRPLSGRSSSSSSSRPRPGPRSPPLSTSSPERSARRGALSSPSGAFTLGDIRARALDQPPGARLPHGLFARGDPKLAVDGFDLGSHRARGDVEAVTHLPGGERPVEQAKHGHLTLGHLPVERSVPLIGLAKPALLALQKGGEDAGVIAERLQDGARLVVYPASRASIAAREVHPRKGEHTDEGGPGAYPRQLRSC